MYTLCTYCKTLFRINAQQLAAAQGRVRCGVCRASFSALDNLAERPDDLLPRRQSAVQGSTSVAKGRMPEATAVAVNPAVGLVAEDAMQPASEPAFAARLVTGQEAMEVKRSTGIDESAGEFDLINAPPIVAGERLDPASVARPERVSLAATLAWSAINLALIFILATQFVYFNRHDLAQQTEWRPALEEMCRYAGCDLPPQRDITKITLINRELRSHPAVANALLVTATLVNNAAFRQPYPMLQLSLSDFSGRTVAMRRFDPVEYMGKVADIQGGMRPGQPVEVSLELADPGKAAVGFEFSFI